MRHDWRGCGVEEGSPPACLAPTCSIASPPLDFRLTSQPNRFETVFHMEKLAWMPNLTDENSKWAAKYWNRVMISLNVGGSSSTRSGRWPSDREA